MTAPSVLVLAGLDPSGGAGLFADAEAIRELGARPLCVPTALTVQSRARARSFEPVSPEYLLAAAAALLEEEAPGAIKLGMLASPEIARAIAVLLENPAAKDLPIVLDPVLAASSGAPLFRGSIGEARAALASLWTRCLLTPNALEAQLLLEDPAPPQTPEELERAARRLIEAGARAVLIKGGHAKGDQSIDLLLDRSIATRFAGPRLLAADQGPLAARGTGCRFASAMAAALALGCSLPESARLAKAQVARYLAGSP